MWITKFFFSFVYIKWLILPKKSFKNNDIEVIVDSVNTLWLNEKNVGGKLGHKNLPAATNR